MTFGPLISIFSITLRSSAFSQYRPQHAKLDLIFSSALHFLKNVWYQLSFFERRSWGLDRHWHLRGINAQLLGSIKRENPGTILKSPVFNEEDENGCIYLVYRLCGWNLDNRKIQIGNTRKGCSFFVFLALNIVYILIDIFAGCCWSCRPDETDRRKKEKKSSV